MARRDLLPIKEIRNSFCSLLRDVYFCSRLFLYERLSDDKRWAKRLNVDPSRVRQMVLGGIIKAEKFGRDLVIAEDEIKRIEQLDRRPGRPMKVKSEQA